MQIMEVRTGSGFQDSITVRAVRMENVFLHEPHAEKERGRGDRRD
jgi:hypothetical protein